MDQLARRGTQIIALVPSIDDPVIQELIPAMRTATSNELIYAEECDLGSSTSIREFCKRLIQPQPSMDGQGRAEPSRLDAVILMHEYLPNIPVTAMSSLHSKSDVLEPSLLSRQRRASTATFLLTTLILPSLLRAPSDRDIRFINVVNPLYAAAIPTFDPASREEPKEKSLFAREGARSLRSIILGRHLQRVFDALLATSAKSEQTGPLLDPNDTSAHSSLAQMYKGSNILSVVVSPGYGSQYIRQLLSASGRHGLLYSLTIRPLL